MTEDDDVSLRSALTRARSTEEPGPDTSAGPAVTRLGDGGPVVALGAGAGQNQGQGEGLDLDLDLDQILTRSLAAAHADGRLRPAPSAGALHPVNAHVLAGPGCSVPAGRYAYDPVRHRLYGRGHAPAGVADGAVIVLTVTVRRTASHYAHRAWPMALLDAGHAVAALAVAGARRFTLDADAALLAAAAGLPVPGSREERWPDAIPEHPFAAVHFMPPGGVRTSDEADDALLRAWAGDADAVGLRGAGSRRTYPTEPRRAYEVGAAERVLELLGAAPRAGGGTWVRPSAPLPPVDAALRRRSVQPPLPGVPDPDELAAVMAAAAGQRGTRWCLAVGGPRAGLLELASESLELVTLARGDARPTLAVWAARQGWLADSGAVLLAYGCPGGASAVRVRQEHLAAGVGVGLAQVTATALGLRSRPVGSWQGADLGAALGGPTDQDWIIHGLALGRGRTP
ncbi:nitroreductase family protein [Streptomyces apocyni]|uniref:nitroreductase n=1 Tax=Streptomyces apocyni TaxID=2654677 RepID=UPI0012EA98A9|nr:nitroreductase [Streptomyces apocyni]